MWIVKIGGSLAKSRDRERWLSIIKSWRAVGLVVVPGGGPFADCVRAMQAPCRYDNATGHAMAVLAMEQYATLLAACCDAFLSCDRREEIHQAIQSGKIALWRPHYLVSRADDIAKTWDHTSDSLAAWLARALKAEGILLIKSRDPEKGRTPRLEDLQASGLIDPAMGSYLRGTALHLHCAGPSTLETAQGGLKDWHHQGPGIPVAVGSKT